MSKYNSIKEINSNIENVTLRHIQDKSNILKAKQIIKKDPNLSFLEKRKYKKQLKKIEDGDTHSHINDVLDEAQKTAKENLEKNREEVKIKKAHRLEQKENNSQGIFSLLLESASDNIGSWLIPAAKIGVNYALMNMLPRFSPVPPSPFDYNQSFGNFQNPFFGGGFNGNIMNFGYNPPPAYLTTHTNPMFNAPVNMIGDMLQPMLMQNIGQQLSYLGNYNSPFTAKFTRASKIGLSALKDSLRNQKNQIIGRGKTAEQKAQNDLDKKEEHLKEYERAKEKFNKNSINRKVDDAYQQVESKIPEEHKNLLLLEDTNTENQTSVTFKNKDEFKELILPKLNPDNQHPLAQYYTDFKNKKQIKNLDLNEEDLQKYFLECVYKKYIDNQFNKHIGEENLIDRLFNYVDEQSGENDFHSYYEEKLDKILKDYNTSHQNSATITYLTDNCFEELANSFKTSSSYHPYPIEDLKNSDDNTQIINLEKITESVDKAYEKLRHTDQKDKKEKSIILNRITLYAELIALSHVNNLINLPYGNTLIDEQLELKNK